MKRCSGCCVDHNWLQIVKIHLIYCIIETLFKRFSFGLLRWNEFIISDESSTKKQRKRKLLKQIAFSSIVYKKFNAVQKHCWCNHDILKSTLYLRGNKRNFAHVTDNKVLKLFLIARHRIEWYQIEDKKKYEFKLKQCFAAYSNINVII